MSNYISKVQLTDNVVAEIKDANAQTSISNINGNIGNMSNLHTTDKTSLVDSINELVSSDQGLQNNIGNLTNLSTTDKTNLVGAINEVNQTGGGAIGMIGNLNSLNTTNKSNVVSAVNEVNTKANTTNTTIGNITNLNTPLKNSVVNSINSFYASRNEIIVNVKDFGAVGDGVADDSDAIDAAINSLPVSGGTVFFPAGNYGISRAIAIGDGQASETDNGNASTKQNIKLIGVGCSRGSTPNVTQITPLADISAVIIVNGLINNVVIDGFNLYANGRASYGLFICATNYSTFKNIEIYNPTYCGLALVGGKAPTGNYNTGCLFKQILVSLNTSSTIGLRLTGDISANNDTWLTTFEDCRFQSLSGTSNCTSGEFRFCDNITFIRCHFVTYSSTGRGIDLNALDSVAGNPFPTGLSFIDCSIANTVITEDVGANKRIGVNRFYGYGLSDGEQLPLRDCRLIGFDSEGNFFGGFGSEELGTIQDVINVMNKLPNKKSIPVVCDSNLTNTLFNIETMSSGLLTRVNDTLSSLSINNNVGFYYCLIDTAGNVTVSKAMTWPS